MGCGPSSRRRDADTFSSVVEEKTVERVETNKKNTLTRVNQYKVDKMLGKGAFGAVYSATDEKSEIVAIKVMDKAELRKKSKAIPGKPGLGGRPGLSKPGMSPKPGPAASGGTRGHTSPRACAPASSVADRRSQPRGLLPVASRASHAAGHGLSASLPLRAGGGRTPGFTRSIF